MTPDHGRTVLVAGGTRGIGRAIGLAFAQTGARVVLTHRWGSVDPVELEAEFDAHGATKPHVIEADVANPDDTAALLATLGTMRPDVFVSNVSVVGRGTGTLSERDLQRSLEYSAWPLLRYVDAMCNAWGAPPRYVVATSSDGPDRFYPGYDYVAAAKSVLESLCAQLAARYAEMRINALRARQVDTTGYREMFGPEARAVVSRFARFDLEPIDVAKIAVALCSGDLDGLSGAVVTADRGAGPLDNLVNVAPTLLGGSALWESAENTERRPAGVLWVDAGVTPGDATLCGPVQVVTPDQARAIDAAQIPDAVVIGCDWRKRELDDEGSARLLLQLLDRAAQQGGAPKYGIRVDRATDPPAPGEALARALDLYWNSWHIGGDARINAVRYTNEAQHAQAVSAARALLSGSLDALRGQVLQVTREALA